MTRDEAKRILSLYRPWAGDVIDPEFAEALAMARTDVELKQWFEQHCASQSAIHAGFEQIAVPPGLNEQIISERRAQAIAMQRRKSALIAVAAVLLVAGVLAGWWLRGQADASETDLAGFRNRMVRTALRAYSMDLETNDIAVVRAYLAGHSAPTNYVVPKPLANSQTTGCGVLSWQGHRVSMVCFYSGQPLPPGEKTDLFLFVTDTAGEKDPVGTAHFARVNKMTTAIWTRDGMVYLLATPGNEDFLKRFL